MKRQEHRREAHCEILVQAESSSEEPGWASQVGLAFLEQDLAFQGHWVFLGRDSAFLVGLVFQGLDWVSQGLSAFQERLAYQTGFVGEQVEL
jgi:hypothetical protein